MCYWTTEESAFSGSLTYLLPTTKQYINGFDSANKRIGELQNCSKKFAAFLQGTHLSLSLSVCVCVCVCCMFLTHLISVECQSRDNKKLDLASYLIMPVQRLPRYELLLKDLIRNTPPGEL